MSTMMEKRFKKIGDRAISVCKKHLETENEVTASLATFADSFARAMDLLDKQVQIERRVRQQEQEKASIAAKREAEKKALEQAKAKAEAERLERERLTELAVKKEADRLAALRLQVRTHAVEFAKALAKVKRAVRAAKKPGDVVLVQAALAEARSARNAACKLIEGAIKRTAISYWNGELNKLVVKLAADEKKALEQAEADEKRRIEVAAVRSEIRAIDQWRQRGSEKRCAHCFELVKIKLKQIGTPADLAFVVKSMESFLAEGERRYGTQLCVEHRSFRTTIVNLYQLGSSYEEVESAVEDRRIKRARHTNRSRHAA